VDEARIPGNAALENAVGYMRRALEVDSNFTSGILELGYLLDAQGKVDEAAAMYTRAIATDSTSALAYYNLARLLWAQGKAIEGNRVAAQLLKVAPTSRYSYFLRAQAAEHGEDDATEVAVFTEALRRYPGDNEFLTSLASSEVSLANKNNNAALLNRAIKRLEAAVQRDSTNDRAYFVLAYTYHVSASIRDLKKAERYYQKCLQYNPRDIVSLGNLVPIKLERMDFDSVITLSRRVLELSPGNEEAIENIGYAYHLKGELSAAITWYDSALSVPKGARITAHMMRGEALLLLGRFGEAHKEIQAAREAFVRDAIADATTTWTLLILAEYDPGGRPKVVYYGTRAQKAAALELADAVVSAADGDEEGMHDLFGAATARLQRQKADDREVVRYALSVATRLKQQATPGSPADRVLTQLATLMRPWVD